MKICGGHGKEAYNTIKSLCLFGVNLGCVFAKFCGFSSYCCFSLNQLKPMLSCCGSTPQESKEKKKGGGLFANKVGRYIRWFGGNRGFGSTPEKQRRKENIDSGRKRHSGKRNRHVRIVWRRSNKLSVGERRKEGRQGFHSDTKEKRNLWAEADKLDNRAVLKEKCSWREAERVDRADIGVMCYHDPLYFFEKFRELSESVGSGGD